MGKVSSLRGQQPDSDRLFLGRLTIGQWHSIDRLLAIDLVLVVAAITDKSLLSGTNASTVATRGRVPVYKAEITIGVSGFVPR